MSNKLFWILNNSLLFYRQVPIFFKKFLILWYILNYFSILHSTFQIDVGYILQHIHLSNTIDKFRVSDPILLRSANSGQTTIKCCDLACNAEPLLLKNFKNFTMKLDVTYLFPTLCSDINFYIYQLPEGLGMRKMLAHGIRI